MKIAIKDIKLSPYQVRDLEGDAELEALAESIREHGQLQPIKVRPSEGHFECVFGHRRLKAAELAGLESIEAVVAETTDQEAQIQTLIENTQRKDLEAMELARSLRSLRDATGWNKSELARHTGLSRQIVADSLALLDEPSDVQEMIHLDMGHRGPVGDRQAITREHVGKVRTVVADGEPRADILRKAAKESLTVDQTRKLAERYRDADTPEQKQRVLEVPAKSQEDQEVIDAYLDERAERFRQAARRLEKDKKIDMLGYIAKVENASRYVLDVLMFSREARVWEAPAWPAAQVQLKTIVERIEEFLAEVDTRVQPRDSTGATPIDGRVIEKS